ncbi:hypothetical protein E6C27_scaffold381G00430 [Cucumis melo var. makuwa]|uniref:Uncharacterized protein n=1 Tax=Cucumis melo var. makuwa TaxID=1194695 RepID=A0A5A7V4I7_CUCMM|nr:hypothetical protein E6C27_scaffold381G00430 [Cucumis melo var. makuwa]
MRFRASTPTSSSNNDSKNIVNNPIPPFSSRLSQPQKEFNNGEELLEVFKKVEVNLPLLTTKSSNDHLSLCALETFESLETLEKHDQFDELIDQATLEYVENEFAKNKPSDDDISIFLDFFASVNDEHVLVDNIATNEQHVLDNDFAYSNEHDLGRNIKDDDEHILKSIGIENDHDASIHIKCHTPSRTTCYLRPKDGVKPTNNVILYLYLSTLLKTFM